MTSRTISSPVRYKSLLLSNLLIYNNPFHSGFNPNFLKYPNDAHVLEYRPRKTLSLNESNSVINSQTPNLLHSQASSRKDSCDSFQSNKEKIIVDTTRFGERKVSFEEPKVTKSAKPKTAKAESDTEGKENCIPVIKISSADSDEPINECKTPSLKEIMSENSKQFNENMEKLKKSLEQNLHRYKAQLE